MASLTKASSSTNLTYPRTGKRGVPQQFPRRLYEMLEAENNSRSSLIGANQMQETAPIIEWSESGRAFRISDISLFATKVLPKYFRTSKFSSFQRNLNLYGFTKVRRGPDTDMYAHPSFLRGFPQTLSQLRKCTSSNSTSRKIVPSGSISSFNSISSPHSSLSSKEFFSCSTTTSPEPILEQSSSTNTLQSQLPPNFVTPSSSLKNIYESSNQVVRSTLNEISYPATNVPFLSRELMRNTNISSQPQYPKQDITSQPDVMTSSCNNIHTYKNSSRPDFSRPENPGRYSKGSKLALLTIALTAIGDCD